MVQCTKCLKDKNSDEFRSASMARTFGRRPLICYDCQIGVVPEPQVQSIKIEDFPILPEAIQIPPPLEPVPTEEVSPPLEEVPTEEIPPPLEEVPVEEEQQNEVEQVLEEDVPKKRRTRRQQIENILIS